MDPSIDSWGAIAALAGVGFVSGFMNVLAGGGSLLTLPLLLFLGMPAPVANATNRIGLVLQNISASTAFHRGGRLPLRPTLWLLLPFVPGAYVGAVVAVDVDETLFRRVLIVMMLLALYSILHGQGSRRLESTARVPHPALLGLSFALMGFYAGFMQAGLGFLLIAALSGLGGFDLVRANAIKVSVVLISQLLALAVFQRAGNVDWRAGAVLAVGSAAGAWVGARWQMRRGVVWVRRVLVTLLVFVLVQLVRQSLP
jgi:uncharacterized membrane protein YfcA